MTLLKMIFCTTLLVLVSGCASIIGDQSQPISIDTPNCPEASCRLSNSEGTYFVKSTPETVVVNKAFGDMTMTCEKGKEQETSVHKSSANIATFGNLLLGGPLFSKEYGSLMLIPPGLSSLDIEEFAEKGPLVIKGILTYAILPWQIVFGSKMKAFE